ncbi:hypothetical protein [Nocardioides sp. R-C-SC26]|uniref:hypothetical protein n=1 Tax=Nocardioides sp. R-C-SC26 TaxID=2870414 RepID=UPI001E3FCBFD|nr:hypothetical protein [Nocardioides sp. R-C-SC26]
MLRFLLMFALFVLATYLLVRALQRATNSQHPAGGGRRPQQRPIWQPKPRPKIVAPDDDEDFLRDLDRKRLRPDDATDAQPEDDEKSPGAS